MISAAKASDVLLTQRPFAAVVDDSHLETHCSGCFRTSKTPMLRCSTCSHIHYCSPKCQRGDWPVHKLECRYLHQIHPKRPQTTVRILARILIAISLRPSENPLSELIAHRDLFPQSQLDKFVQIIMLLGQIVPEVVLSPLEMMDLCCSFSVNSMSVYDDETVNIGAALYTTASLINHSCRPNAALYFGEGGKAFVRALTEINSGDEVSISYISNFKAKESRKQELSERYFFECGCPECVQDRVDPRASLIHATCRDGRIPYCMSVFFILAR